jgi:hypothetical protein
MRDAVLCCRLIRVFFFVLFFNNHVVLVTELSVVIFQLVFVPWLLCAECKKVVVSLGPYSCALCTKWRECADCRLLDVM